MCPCVYITKSTLSVLVLAPQWRNEHSADVRKAELLICERLKAHLFRVHRSEHFIASLLSIV